MKNPYMSAWLSEWHKMANASKGQLSAEMSRQQKAMMQEWQTQMIDLWMAIWMPWATPPKSSKSRRK